MAAKCKLVPQAKEALHGDGPVETPPDRPPGERRAERGRATRRQAQRGAGRQKLGKISTDATCIPRVFDPPLDTHAVYFRDLQGWVEVKLEGREVWIKRDFLDKQPKEECLPRP
jgi:hypothetical protein